MKKIFKAFTVTSIITILSGCTQIREKGNPSKTSWLYDEHSHWHTCTDAGCVDSKKDVAEHTFSEEVVPPTFEEKGYTLHTCETCGFQFKDNQIDVLEHNYSSEWSSDEKNHWHACTDKGYASYKKDEGKHTPSEWIIDEESTATGQGTKYKKCTVCGRRLVDETIDKIPNEIVDYSNLIFTQLDSGSYSVKAASQSVEKVVIPSTYNGKLVTMIERNAFFNCISLKSIEIPDNVTSIGEFAFSHCTSLTSITIPNSVTSIGKYAFRECRFLKSITIPDSVTFIDDYAFYCCYSLRTINFEGTREQWNAISKGEGWNDETPTSMVINCVDDPNIYDPNLIFTELDSGNYSVKVASQSVEEVVIPTKYNGKLVTMIENNAFSHCTSLTSITIPDSVTSIGEFAFYNCSSLTSITIPNSVASIGNDAFSDCTSLKSITIPNSVTSIGEYAFAYCSSLRTISFDGKKEQWNTITKDKGWNNETPTSMEINFVGDLAFTQLSSCSYSVKAVSKSVEEVVIPSTYNGKPVIVIEKDAFADCTSLNSITIPNSVTSIGNNAFNHCTSLTSITIPTSITSIGNSSFYNCTSLTSITIPTSVISLGACVFGYCESLTSITIPNSVTYIGPVAFDHCTSLKAINFDGTSAEWNTVNKGRGWDDGTPTNMVINCVYDYLLFELHLCNYFTKLLFGLDSYYSVKAASKSVEKVVIPSMYKGIPVTCIDEKGFFECRSLKSITIPNSVTSIGYRAFEVCSSLTSITIPNSVTSFGKYAFYNCSSLQTINFDGTKEQWLAISKGEGWYDKTPTQMVVNCSDGKIIYL